MLTGTFRAIVILRAITRAQFHTDFPNNSLANFVRYWKQQQIDHISLRGYTLIDHGNQVKWEPNSTHLSSEHLRCHFMAYKSAHDSKMCLINVRNVMKCQVRFFLHQ